MTKHVLNAKVKPSVWENLIKNIERFPEKRLQMLHAELTAIYEHEWLEIERIWTLPNVSEKMWDNYKWMFDGQDVLPEQRMLRKAQKAFRERWHRFRTKYRKLIHELTQAKKTKSTKQPGSKAAKETDSVPGS
jgi:hypothetical protein